MKLLTALIAVMATGSTFVAASTHDSRSFSSRHSRIAQREVTPRDLTKRCKPRTPANDSGTDAAKAAQAQRDKEAADKKAAEDKKNAANSNNNSGGNNNNSGNNNGILNLSSGSCGNSGATKDITATSGPNGGIDFFNCGIEGGGWTPPKITINDVKTVDLRGALNDPNSPFHACKDFLSTFEKYAWQHGIPPIIIASFAMQESSCNPNTVGGGGEQGLMQITREKCGGRSDEDCRNPEYNIATGVAFFADLLKNNDGSLLVCIGRYNGWFPGMTHSNAVAAGNTAHCRNQNNLDYMQQMLNGWFQNFNVYSGKGVRLGKYFNLDKC